MLLPENWINQEFVRVWGAAGTFFREPGCCSKAREGKLVELPRGHMVELG